MILDARETLILAIFVLFLGKYLNKKILFFREYNIPEPVTGGVLASIFFGLIYFYFDLIISFSLDQRDTLLIVFFTTIGLSAKFSTLIRGGKTLFILLILAIIFLFIQNLTGISVANLTNQSSYLGLISGSISLSGGHGTTIAWSESFINDYNIKNALEIGIACATFGLVFGGLIGGPIASYLIKKHNLKPSKENAPLTVGIKYNIDDTVISVDSMLIVLFIISICIGLGTRLHAFLLIYDIQLPMFVTCLFSGIIMTNTIPFIFKGIPWPTSNPSLPLISDLALGLFLAMSLMSLQLWTLVDLALPLVVVLIMQVIFTILFSIFVVFKLLGKSYDSAVIASGYAGLAMGATPTAIANMTAVTKKYGVSHKAFIVVPLVGAFFIDIANAIIINIFISILS
ncbi:MAG: sodium/glutamate symporter [Campylobacteraceae bacterium]|nr:sodium/glutamate symporter [Campylobacteraceae bacterium]